MKTKKMLGVFAAALTALACALPGTAKAGDIRSIEVYQDTETTTKTYPNMNNPLVAGETVKFKIRLLNRGMTPDNVADATYTNPWTIQHVGLNDPIADTNDMPQVGLWISGQRKYAKIESLQPNPDYPRYFTDVICSYKVEPGDLAMPLKLVRPDGLDEAMEVTGSWYSEDYYVKNFDRWSFFPAKNEGNTTSNRVEFSFGPVSLDGSVAALVNSADLATKPARDYNLAAAGIYIQAVDFDDQMTDDEGIWRNIAANSTTASPALPRLKIPSGSAYSQKLYVWTADPTVAEVESNDTYVFGDGKTRKVGTVNVKPGDEYVPFKIKGLVEGGTTEVFMAATPTNVYNAAGTMLTNFTVRTIHVTEALPPGMTVEIEPDVVKTSSDYTMSVAAINVRLTQAWTNAEDLVITLKPSMKDGSGLDAFDYIGLSKLASDKEAHSQKELTLTIPRNGDSAAASMIYLYANRADEHTLKGITFEVDQTKLSAAAKNFFTGSFMPDTIEIDYDGGALKVLSPIEGATYAHVPGNVAHNFEVTIEDAIGEIESTDGPYTVWWDNNGSGNFVAVEGLNADAKGRLIVPRTYVTAMEYNSQFYVENRGGAKSEVRHVKVSVDAPKTVTGTVDKGVANYVEGETASVTFDFSDTFQESTQPGYIFVVPLDEATSNLVDITTQSDENHTSSVVVYPGMATANSPAKIRLKDGYNGATLSFGIEVRDANDNTKNNIITAWVGKQFFVGVDNVEPAISYISMNETPVKTNGGSFTSKVPIGVQKIFTIGIKDPALEVDFADGDKAYTQIKFWENGAVVDTRIIKGVPTGKSVTHTFMNAGNAQVTAKVRDKDMTDQEFDEAPEFTVNVVVVDAPAITLAPNLGSNIFNETDTGIVNGRINVELTVPPSGLEVGEVITAVLEVTRNGIADGDLPTLNKYEVTFGNGQSTGYFYLSELDGTPQSELKGFRIRAYIKETTTCPIDTTKTWRQYYQSVEDFDIFVANVDPKIGPGDAISTNERPAALNVPFTITWNVRDVIKDQENMKVTWSYNGSSQTTTQSATGTYSKEILFTSAGSKTVTLMVEDKDGGTDTRTWYYRVEASMGLELTPRRPNAGALSKFSQMYTQAVGIGAGRVWCTSADAPTRVSNFTQSWDFQPANDLNPKIYAFGYKLGDIDNGTLGPAGSKDFAVDAAGTWYNDPNRYGSHYNYNNADSKDSYFYCWLLFDRDEGNSTHLNGTIQPQVGDGTGENSVQMPDYDEEAASYVKTMVEGIFSIERFQEDNVGDINLDGIPDIYAAGTTWDGGLLFEAAGYMLEEGGDLKNLADNNIDEDFLPISGVYNGGTLVVPQNYWNNWSTAGGAFTAYTELRGTHDGLNYRRDHNGLNRNVRGPWISDPVFSEAESNAVARVNGLTIPDATLDPESQEYKDQVDAWKAGLEKEDSWIPENRTDPTMADTDSDGFPDGYEYFIWYKAMVGEMVDGEVVRLSGSRFTLDDIATGEEITPDEIAEAFNPTVKAAGKWEERDTDNDGLTDMEEYALGTSPINWDTDGDGLSDFWEVINGLNPMKVDGANGARMNADGDYMARYTTEPDYMIVKIKGKEYALTGNGGRYVAYDEETQTFVLADSAKEEFVAIPVFRYGKPDSEVVPKNREDPLAEEVINFELEEDEELTLEEVHEFQPLMLIHDQVYAVFGYDPRTGWYVNPNGLLNDRWYLKPEQQAGTPVNTVPFTARDEYLLLKYRYETGMPQYVPETDTVRPFSPETDRADFWNATQRRHAEVFSLGTTNPNVAWSDPEYVREEMGEVAYANEAHGADTDGNGVPDGWELYVGQNPNTKELTDAAGQPTGIREADNDGLGLAAEFAGTDSCAAYEGCESIYANHPGLTRGWWNKFFPTDPSDDDTDADGLVDGAEGTGWSPDGSGPNGVDMFYYWRYGKAAMNGNVVEYWRYDNARQANPIPNQPLFRFIYGPNNHMPAGDDGSVCIRGGGLNPCSVDTDGDLLPDPWEMQFAGLVFSNGNPVWCSLNPASLVTLINRADRMAQGGTTEGEGNDNEAAAGGPEYITAGMDGTYAGDAYANPSLVDAVTKTVRDFDFDHDGLQNFQEYLVQAVRHFRYDDNQTPLMGSWMADGTLNSRKFVSFLPMNVMDGETFYQQCREAGFAATAAWDFKRLGYFAPPTKAWDKTSLTGSSNYGDEDGEGSCYRIMMPAGTTYACTDPRLWDTDEDGMDDFYELFHGLNPLLGSIQDGTIDFDIVARAHWNPFMPLNHWQNAWTGNPATPWPDNGGQPIFDVMAYPWMMGAPEADADGDGLRNSDEALLVNMPSPQPTHTDPTPLWYTDRTSLNDASFTRQYYQTDAFINAQGGIPDLAAYPWPWVDSTYMFNFEENEGYDTDSDHISDLDEKTMTATTIADPQDANDPDRRQAIWFPGNESAAVSYSGELSRPIGEVNTTVYRGPLSRPVGQAYDLLRQFTVEAWINPEDVTRKQVVLERVSEYCSSTLSNRVVQIRANFRIGILEDGRIYGCFDTSDAIPSGTGMGTPTVIGTPAEQGKWMHVALTYDGKELKLHQNGRVSGVTQTALIPANGIVSVQQEAVIGMKYFPVLNGGYVTFPIAFVMGARALDGLAIGLTEETTWDSFADYYAGYVDEVRVWDGARTLEDIQNTYKLRMKTSDVSAQRDEVYVAWMQGATRNDNDGKEILPPELVQHYSFQTLPGAINASDVMWEPSGFSKNVFDNVRDMDGVLPAGTFECGWLSRLPVRSTVYENYTWIPWIQNSCQHLPFYDGFSMDSHYWSEFFGGMTMAREVYNSVNDEPSLGDIMQSAGVKKYIFPNTAQPYNLYFEAVEDLRPFFLETMAIVDPSCQTNVNLNLFAQRTRFVGPSDLVPLGGTFAKRCESMWDGDGAADAWELTADGDSAFTDVDANGIPDWWQRHAKENYGATSGFDWNTMVTRNGLEITAREAYLRDLAEGILPSASGAVFDDRYISRRDDDKDGIPDWWESLKGILPENAYSDHDGDQLSNYAEYLISEGFSNYGFPRVDPIKPSTFGDDVTDYFLRVGSLYLGEMFTDHDMMADAWEDKFSVEWTSRGVWDALKDPDDDGWSNWSEYQAGTDPSSEALLTVDGATMAEYPVPVVEASICYNGKKSFNAPIVIQAWAQDNTSDKTMGGLPDAAWKVATSGDATERVKVLGINRGRKVTYCLGPGSVVAGSVTVMVKDMNFLKLIPNEQTGEFNLAPGFSNDAQWDALLSDRMRHNDSTKGDIIVRGQTGGTGVVGEIDYTKGLITIDFACDPMQDYSILELEGDNGGYSLFDHSQSFFEILWTAQKIDSGSSVTLYLGESLSAIAANDDDNGGDVNESIKTRYGHLREGRNLFTAFADIDGNGKWTPGEPYGIAANVQVGWSSASFSIELTDTTPQMARMDLVAMTGGTEGSGTGGTSTGTDGTDGGDTFTDRSSSVNGYYSRNQTVKEAYKYLEVTGDDTTDGEDTGAGVAAGALDPNDEGMPGPSAITRIRVVRTAVNGDLSFNGVDWNQVVLDREIYLGGHPTLTEADLVADGLLDLDWGTLAQAWKDTHNQSAIMTGLTNVSYRVIYGNGSDTEWDFNSFAPVVFVNCFEYGRTQTLCVPVSPKGTIYGTTGIGTTFEWTHKAVDANGYKIKDYPAFRLQVLDESNAVVFDSGDLPAPARNSLGVYSWKAPLYAGMVTQNGKVFDTKQNYKWQVSMLDAKFTTPAWHTPQAFRLEATGMLNDGRRYGTLAANVRYFGPLVNNVSTSKANLKNIIRVQAFTTPDFAGQPVGEGMVTNASMLASTSLEAINAVTFAVPTLEPVGETGKFYLCAYIDTNGNGVRDDWESWGYACNIGNGKENVYAPVAVEIVEPSSKVPSVNIFIEDCDKDNDGFPDAWEMQTFGSLDAQSSAKGNTFYTKANTALVYSSALSSFSDLGLTELSSGGAYVFPKLMSILLGGDDMAALLINGIALEDATADLTVNIDAFTPESMGVTVSAKAPTLQGATLMAAQPTESLKFDLVLLSKKDLRDNWTETTVKQVEVPLNSKVDIADPAIGAKIKELKDHTFFKVKLVPVR